MEKQIIETGFAYLIIFLAVVGIIFWTIKHIGEVNAKRAKNLLTYDIMYENIKTIIENWPVNERNYHIILDYLTTLGQQKHKNKEKTTVLTVEFFKKYEAVLKVLNK